MLTGGCIYLAAVPELEGKKAIRVDGHCVQGGGPEPGIKFGNAHLTFGDGEQETTDGIGLDPPLHPLGIDGIQSGLCRVKPFYQSTIPPFKVLLALRNPSIFLNAFPGEPSDHFHLLTEGLGFGIQSGAISEGFLDDPAILKNLLSVNHELIVGQ